MSQTHAQQVTSVIFLLLATSGFGAAITAMAYGHGDMGTIGVITALCSALLALLTILSLTP